jgi:hypothetical protein
VVREAFRRIFSFPGVLAATLVFWVVKEAATAVWDPDIWFHLRNVEYLFAHGHTPQIDVFSYTTNQHALVDHQWLAEVLYYFAWWGGGLLGIYVLFVSLLVIIHFGICYLAFRASGTLKASFLLACLSVFLTSVSFGPRTLLFGYVYLLILLLLLDRYRAAGRTPLWAIPPLFCLWINSHGTWLLGMVILGIFIVSGLVEGCWGRVIGIRWTPQQLRRLLITAAASVVALFANPSGYRLVIYPFEMAFRQKLNVAYTDEWASVDFHTPRGTVAFFFLAAVLLGILLSRHSWRIEDVLMAGLGIYSALMHIRFLFLAAILLAPLLAKALDCIPPYRREIDKPWLNAAVMGLLLIGAIHYVPTRGELTEGLEKRYPVRAVAFMRARGLTGNIFNRYSWGGYLVGCCPEIKTFIDSRADLFEYSGVMQDYLHAEAVERPFEVMDKYQVRYALIPPHSALAYLLKHNTAWKEVYADEVATILERVHPPPAAAAPAPAAGSVH